MADEDLNQARQAIEDVETIRRQRSITAFSPAQEIETNLMGLLKFRIDRIRRGASFEEELEQAMLDRLPEATYSEMLQTLAMIKRDQNDSTTSVLAPFISKSDRVPLLDSDKAKERAGSDEQIFSEASKEVLQGLGEFSKLLSIMGKTNPTAGGGASTTAEGSEKK